LDIVKSEGPEQYCRDIEAYLCRKNDGHIVRIVGPAFEQVCGWAVRGVPIKVAYRGIDRYFDRYYATGPRRRPVRVEFCEADVLDAFDEWRRALGIAEARAGGGEADAAVDAQARRRESLPSHLDRTMARLTSLRAGDARRLDAVLDAIVREIDSSRLSAKGLRGDAREAFVKRLGALDSALLDAARGGCDADTLSRLAGEADEELAPFRERMTADAYRQSKRACMDRLLRERLRLPVIAFDQ
jgi:hypothetical protein